MKKHSVVYDEKFIEYWPMYSISLIALAIVNTLAVIVMFIIMYDAIRDFPLLITDAIVGGVLFPLCCLMDVYLLRNMFVKLTITHEGIRHENSFTKQIELIQWDEVDSLCWVHNRHFAARTVVKVLLKTPCRKKYTSEKEWDYALNISFLRLDKVLDFIPKDLWPSPKDLWP